MGSFMKRKRDSPKVERQKKKLKKQLKDAATQAVIDGAVGYAFGGPPAAAMGAVTGAIQGARSAGNDPGEGSRRGKVFTSRKAGRKGKGKKRTKRMGRKNKRKHPTNKLMEKKGVRVTFEKRKTFDGSSSEAILIGHTSMPVKLSAHNMWRAIVKYLMVKAGLHIKDYGNCMTNEGFVAGDIIRVSFYTEPQSTTTTTFDVTVNTTMTYDKVAFEFAKTFQAFSTDDRKGDRLDSIEIIPYAGTAFSNASKISACNVELNTLKVTLKTHSILKLQNVTVEKAGADEADDVERVPLVGKVFKCKGNNVMRKSNSEIAPGFFNDYNDDCIAKGWTKNTATSDVNLEYYNTATAGSNSTETVFTKPAEVPKRWEFNNCDSEQYVTLQPGSIHTSRLDSTVTVSLLFLYNLLYGSGSQKHDKMYYDPKVGHTRFFYLEKMVGRTPVANVNAIKLWVELEVSQTALVHGAFSDYCIPITYQVNYDA